MKKWRKGWTASLILTMTAITTACGTSGGSSAGSSPGAASSQAPAASSPGAQAAAASPAANAQAKKIIVGTGTQFPKVCFIDENGKLTGFDVELVREIDKRLPDYEFEFKTMEFSNLLLSLETKKIDLVAHEMEKNPEREQKYLFNKVPYAHWRNKIIVAKDNNSIQSLDDLAGKKVLTSATSAEAQILENYNRDHEKKIDISYQNGAANDRVNQIVTGRVEATLGADFTLSLIDPQGKLKTTGSDLSAADILFVFRKNDPEGQKLSDAVDGALTAIKSDGTLGKLSKQWLGADFTADASK